MSTEIGGGAPHTVIPKAPLVGRGRESSLLDEAFARVVATRSPHAVSILGGAGIGKGRLVADFVERLAREHPDARIFRGEARRGGASLGVIARLLRARFGVVEGATDQAVREQLRATVTEVLGDRRVTEFLHFLGAYLDVAFPESPFTKAVEAEEGQLERISRVVLRRFLEADAQASPLMLTFESMDDADDETLDLVHYLVQALADAPVLVIVTARPDLLTRRATWSEGGRHARVELAPLSRDDAGELVRALLAPVADPPAELIEEAVEVAGGSHYLLEQMVRTYLASGTLVPLADGTWAVDLARMDEAQLPLSVDEAIEARIASMARAERELMERAAAMGSVFWLGALVSLGRVELEAPALWGGAEDLAAHYRDLLMGLEERDYVIRFEESSIAGEEEYAFKHNLEREALQRLVSGDAAQRLHRRVAEWLETRLTDRGEEALELLAEHYELGGVRHRSATCYITAGDRARARYANAKAAAFYQHGLELLGGDDIPRRIDALHNFGDVLQLLGRNDEALTAFREMQGLAYTLDVKSKGGAAHNRIGRVYRAVGQLSEAMRHLGTGNALFDAAGDTRGVASSLDDVGKVHWMRGAYDAAERFTRRSLELRRDLGDGRSTALSLNNLGLVYQDSGRFDEALEAFQEALSIRRAIGDFSGMSQTLNNLGTIHQDHGDHAQAGTLWQEALEYARRVGDRAREAIVLTNLGQLHYRQGRPEEAIAVLGAAERISTMLGDKLLEAEILRGLSKAHFLLEDIEAARGYISRSIALFEESRNKPFLGVVLRTLAELERASGRAAEAEKAFRQSLDIFHELGNEVEIARSCVGLADFLGSLPAPTPQQVEEAAELRDRALAVQGRQLASDIIPLPPGN